VTVVRRTVWAGAIALLASGVWLALPETPRTARPRDLAPVADPAPEGSLGRQPAPRTENTPRNLAPSPNPSVLRAESSIGSARAPDQEAPRARSEARSVEPLPVRGEQARLAGLEEDAARAALRRAVSHLPAQRRPDADRGADAPGASAARADFDAERRSLSDETLIAHLTAEAYRTTGFSWDQDAAQETRAAAVAFVRALSPAEREDLLRSALGRGEDTEQPLYEPAPRDASGPPP